MREKYMQFWKNGLFHFDHIPQLSETTNVFLEKTGLPYAKHVKESYFFPSLDGAEQVKINGKTYFSVANVSYKGLGDLVIGIEQVEENVFLLDLSGDLSPEYVNLNIEKFGYYLLGFNDFLRNVTEKVNLYEDEDISPSDIKKYIYEKLDTLCGVLSKIDSTALHHGNYWYRFWLANFQLSFMEYIDVSQIYEILNRNFPTPMKPS